MLRQRKLEIVYLGLESGSDEVLRRVRKGITAAEMVEAVHKLKRAGMRASVIAILGLAERNSRSSTPKKRVVSSALMDPEYLSMLTLMLVPGTELHRDMAVGHFRVAGTGGAAP